MKKIVKLGSLEKMCQNGDTYDYDMSIHVEKYLELGMLVSVKESRNGGQKNTACSHSTSFKKQFRKRFYLGLPITLFVPMLN